MIISDSRLWLIDHIITKTLGFNSYIQHCE